jgi:hypothetical protein
MADGSDDIKPIPISDKLLIVYRTSLCGAIFYTTIPSLEADKSITPRVSHAVEYSLSAIPVLNPSFYKNHIPCTCVSQDHILGPQVPTSTMSFNVVTPQTPLPPSILHQLALGSPLDEISNHPDAVRHHIFYHSDRNKKTNKLERSMLFFVYQTGRFGPQNGFRLCLVHQGFHIASATKGEGNLEDDIDRLEKDIPQGHMEVVVLGEAPVYVNDEDGGHIVFEED